MSYNMTTKLSFSVNMLILILDFDDKHDISDENVGGATVGSSSGLCCHGVSASSRSGIK